MKRFFYCACLTVLFFSCSPNNVVIDSSLTGIFSQNNVSGSFAMLNNMNGKFTVYGLSRYRDSSFSPAGTFSIISALAGLQTGIISNDSMVIELEGNDNSNTKSLSMFEAMRSSSIPYFQEINRRLGKVTVQKWVDTLAYGNKNLNPQFDSFWVDNSLKIKPDEQLGLIKKLYFNELPFFKLNQEIVKQTMLIEDNSNYKLSYQTGSAVSENGKNIGWVIGWVEENRHPYFFVLNFESTGSSTEMESNGVKIMKEILTEKGFFLGKL